MNGQIFFNRKIYFVFTLCILLILNTRCNKEFNNVLPLTNNNDSLLVGDGNRRVLYIILDGVRGDVLKSLAPENITKITNRATYSHAALSDFGVNPLSQTAAWSTMMTGVDPTVHRVSDETFNGFDNSVTPTIFTRLKKELSKDVRTVAISSSQGFIDKLSQDATSKQLLSNDQAVKNALVAELTNENPKFVVAQFNSAELSAASDFTTSNTTYANAIRTLDGYIGEALSALNKRKMSDKEGWLVVVASSRGGGKSGGNPDSDVFDDPSRNIFVAFYNPKFSPKSYSKPDSESLPYLGLAPSFISNNSTLNGIANQTNVGIGNFGNSSNYTLMFKMRDNGGEAFYPMFVGKRDPNNNDVGRGGWGFLMGAESFQLDWGGDPRAGGFTNLKDGKWHTLGFTIFQEGADRRLSLFVDGVVKNTVTINNNTDNDYPLRIGTNSNFNTNFLIKDLVILNVALSPSEMEKNMRKEFDENNPYFSNTIGWWAGNKLELDKMSDLSGNGNDFTINSSVQFDKFKDLSPNISPNRSVEIYKTVPNGVDIPIAVYNWLNILVPRQWMMMGQSFVPSLNLPKE